MKKNDVKWLLLRKLMRRICDLETLTAGASLTAYEACGIWQRALQTLEILDDLHLITPVEYVEYSGRIAGAYHSWLIYEKEVNQDVD